MPTIIKHNARCCQISLRCGLTSAGALIQMGPQSFEETTQMYRCCCELSNKLASSFEGRRSSPKVVMITTESKILTKGRNLPQSQCIDKAKAF
jgi:hypothetical protein